MYMLTNYGGSGLQVVTPDPPDAGGAAINANFKALATMIATTNPGVDDDATAGFGAGSRWYNSATTVEWICLDATPGDAEWAAITSGLQAWQTPTLLNSWANAGAPYSPAGYRLDRGVVRLRGLVNGGAVGSVLFVLPAGYLPAAEAIVPVSNGADATGGLAIDTAGNVSLAWGSGSWCSLEGVSFSVN
jgi:hypothetical protein